MMREYSGFPRSVSQSDAFRDTACTLTSTSSSLGAGVSTARLRPGPAGRFLRRCGARDRGAHLGCAGVPIAFGLALLPQADHRVQQGQQHQQDRGAPLLDQQGHDRRRDQDDLHVAAVLRQEPEPARLGFLLWQCVRAVRRQQLRGPLVEEIWQVTRRRGWPDAAILCVASAGATVAGRRVGRARGRVCAQCRCGRDRCCPVQVRSLLWHIPCLPMPISVR